MPRRNDGAAAQLAEVMAEFIALAEELAAKDLPDNQWARDAIHMHRQLNPFEEGIGLTLPYRDVKTLCPSLFAVVQYGIDVANRSGAIFQPPPPLAYLEIDNISRDTSYNPTLHAIKIGLPLVRIMQSTEEISACISHEWGHAYQFVGERERMRIAQEKSWWKFW